MKFTMAEYGAFELGTFGVNFNYRWRSNAVTIIFLLLSGCAPHSAFQLPSDAASAPRQKTSQSDKGGFTPSKSQVIKSAEKFMRIYVGKEADEYSSQSVVPPYAILDRKVGTWSVYFTNGFPDNGVWIEMNISATRGTMTNLSYGPLLSSSSFGIPPSKNRLPLFTVSEFRKALSRYRTIHKSEYEARGFSFPNDNISLK